MIKIITFQDYLKAEDKAIFITSAIDNFKASKFYNNAIDAENYYRGENTTILKRMQYFYNSQQVKTQDQFKANNRVCSEFFNKIIKQENSYLLANGITISEEKIKLGLGKNFDSELQKAGITALVQGVAWGYPYIDNKGKFAISYFKGSEVVPLLDERNGQIMAAIRFWQIDTSKPMYIELYEVDGKTELQVTKEDNKRSIQITKSKAAYKQTIKKDALGSVVAGVNNWGKLPLIPLYGNDIKQSELTRALKSKIDLYDIIVSDFGNNLEDSSDVYWVLKNYQGQDMGEFLADYKYYKSIKVDDDGEASPHTLEVPFEARDKALNMLKTQIYSDGMALDTSILSGGSLTNVAIKAMSMDLDLKTDAFEWCVTDFVNNIIDFYLEFSNQNIEYTINFIRRGIINDTEIIDSIYKMRTDISHEAALRLNPYIDDVNAVLEEIEKESMNKMTIPELEG